MRRKPVESASALPNKQREGADGKLYNSLFNRHTRRWRWVLALDAPPPTQTDTPRKIAEAPKRASQTGELRRARTKREPEKPSSPKLKVSPQSTEQHDPRAKVQPTKSKAREPGPPFEEEKLEGRAYRQGRLLGEGGFGQIFQVEGRQLVIKRSLDPKNAPSLGAECAAMRAAEPFAFMPRCVFADPDMIVMEQLAGPPLSCDDIKKEPVQTYVLEIASKASVLGIDVSDHNPANYMWHHDRLMRIDAEKLPPRPDLDISSPPIMLWMRNFRFYPIEFEEQFYKPNCREIVWELFFAQLAAEFEFKRSFLLKVYGMRDLADEIWAEYERKKLVPDFRANAKGRLQPDFVYKRFVKRIRERAAVKEIDRALLLRPEFLSGLRRLRSFMQPARDQPKKLTVEDKQDDIINEVMGLSMRRMLLRGRKWNPAIRENILDTETADEMLPLADVWLSNCKVTEAKQARLFFFELVVTFMFGGGRLPRDLMDVFRRYGLPADHEDWFEFQVLLGELWFAFFTEKPEHFSREVEAVQPVFAAVGLDDWKARFGTMYEFVAINLKPRIHP